MVQAPRTELNAVPSQRFQLRDLCSVDYNTERVAAVNLVAQRWFARFGGDLSEQCETWDDMPVELQIVTASPRHSGLGSGTQLAMSTGLALQQYFALPMPKPDELAIGLGRAARSAIGTFGCFEGGLIVDRGKTDSESVSPIDLRLDFPEHWPIAIVRVVDDGSDFDASLEGLHGAAEREAFEKLTPTTKRQLAQMRTLVSQQLVPGVLEASYQMFAEAVYEFGRRSGEYFSSIQGGPYASETIAEVIKTIYDSNVHATGQTSWGPSVFVVGESWEHLETAIGNLQKRFGAKCHIEITHADNRGVVISHYVESTI